MSSTIERNDLSLEEKRALVARLLKERARTSNSFPLSFAQQRLWFIDQLEPGSPVYNVPANIRVRGRLNAAALEQSINEIVRRQEALRTTFAAVDGSSVQVIAPTMTVSLPVEDLSKLTKTEREAQALRLATEEAQRPFDLTRGPLVRVSLLRLHDEDHILLLTMHHVVSDGWSVSVLFRELAALYEAFSTSKPSPLPELPIQYADFAVWQREWLQGEVLEKQLSYWKEQLSGAPAMLELPMDRPRPAVQTFQGARQSVLLPKSILKGLNELSRQEGVTLFMTLLAAFQTLLARYTNQEDIVVGSPIANRNRAEIEGLIGFFVNTLVLRTDVSGDPSFRELLGRVREVALGAYAHQDMPFETLVEQLQPERSLSHTPLFQVMFVLQNAPREAPELYDLKLSPLAVDNLTSKFDLTLFMWEEKEALRAVFEYNTDLFETATIKRMLGHFQTLLEGIVADPEQRLATLPLLTEVELKQLLVEWNDSQTDFPRDCCLHQLFERQVERNPDATAVLFKDQQPTYDELNRQANQLAHHLRSLGVGPDVWVGLCVERSLEMVIGILGVLKAGGAYVPLDPAYPKERLAFMLEDTRCSVLLTQHRLLAMLPSHRARVLCLDADWNTIARESPQNPQTAVKGEHLAYIIYTSGSTGRPKGIAIQHRGVVNNLVDLNRRFAVGQADRVLALSSLSFDMCVYEMLGTLEAGAAIVLPEASVEREPAHWAELMARHHVSVWNSAPSLLEKLVEYISGRPELRPRYLRLVLLGGDWVAVSLPDQLKALAPGVQVIVMGGATEASIHSIIYEVERTDPSWKSIPYGRPMANQRAYVLDALLQPVPIGVPGELHLGGMGLARGYFNRPELTAERFIPNPFSKEPGERLYKTGDLARYLSDGNIELLGRMDFQVKIRGFRIELGEIEAVLGQHPAVRETVVMAREDEPGNKRLVAYVVAKEQTSSVSKLNLLKEKLQRYKVPEHLVAYSDINQKQLPSVSEVRSFLKEKLPEYMVPSAFVILEALPLTPGGKVDRRALPMPDHVRPELEKAFVAPRDTLELQLTKVWEKVLGTRPIGVSDNFFDLGGHSLLALRLFAQIEKVLGKNLPLATLFQAPTVEQLAGILRQQGWSPSWSSLVPIQPGGSKPPFFCAHAGGGSVLFYRDLARRLGPNQPFYGFQPRRLNGKYAPHTRVEDMAAHYIKEMRSIQPEGPYFLGGSSLGGKVVFEMAQQLHAQGQKVALVALFDTWGPGYGKFLLNTTSFNWKVGLLRRRAEHHLESLLMLESKDKLTYVWQKMIKVRNQIKRNVKNRRKAITRKLYQAIGRPLPSVLRETQDALSQANRSYVPQIYPGRVTLFRASKQPPGIYPDPTLGWDGLAAEGLEIHEVPGSHGALVVEPRVQFLVEKLRVCLDKAQPTESDEQTLSLAMAAAMHSASFYSTHTM